MLTLAYEDLVANNAHEMKRIFDFLAVEAINVRPHIYKVGTDDLRASISNFGELCRSLAGSEAARWLADGRRESAGASPDSLSPTAFASLAGLARAKSRHVHLVGHVGIQDRDILPHWLAHYRALGVDDIHLILHGPWRASGSALAAAGLDGDVTVAEDYDGEFDETVKCARLTRLAQRFVGDWVLVADADEFLELPFPTLAATLRALRGFGMTSLPAVMLQRVAADGSLPPLDAATDLAATFPLGMTLLIERMAPGRVPIWKTKHPLFLVHAGATVRRGHHLAPDETGVSGFGLQAVVHHFKWRSSLLASLDARSRNDQANGPEMTVVAEWLAGHDTILPTDDAFPCGRDAMVRRGLLRRPTRADIALGVLLHRIRLRGDDGLDQRSAARLASRLDRLGRSWVDRDDGSRASRLPASAPALAMRRADIALVTFEMPPPDRTGGIATWVQSAAASLKRLGHRVTVIYMPFHERTLDLHDRDVWASRGVAVIPLMPDGSPGSDRRAGLARLLVDHRFDVVHLPDAVGFGAMAAAAKRQGLAFHATRFAVTVHGPSDWHNRGNKLARSEAEIRHAHAERRQAEDADDIVAPNAAIAGWMATADYRLARPVPVHPNLLGHGCWSGRRQRGGPATPIRRIVFFGRLEPRKGLALFCDAIDALPPDRDVEIVFLGRAGSPELAEYMQARSAPWPRRTVHFSDWTSEDALLLLAEPGTLAVIPSLTDNYPYTVLECLGGAIPFIATDVGGIPEMVHAGDRDRVLVRPETAALAAALHRALTEGHAAARPADDFATVELQWLAWHGALLDETPEAGAARSGPDAADAGDGTDPADAPPAVCVIVPTIAGAERPRCLASLKRQCDATVEILVARPVAEDDAIAPPPPGTTAGPLAVRPIDGVAADLPARAANLLAGHAFHEYLLFCGDEVEADPEAVSAMARAARRLGAHAMVASHRIVRSAAHWIGTPATTTEEVHPPAGPPALAAVNDVFGGHFFLIRRETFVSLGGFREMIELRGVEHRDLLNRLLLQGGRIGSVPFPIYVEHLVKAPPGPALLAAQRACLHPFLGDSPRWLRDLLSWAVDSGWPWHDEPGDDSRLRVAKAAAEERLTRIRATTLVRRWATLAELTSLEPAGDASAISEADWLTIVARGPDPMLLLPPLDPMPVAPIHVVVDLLTPEPTEAQLFWSTPDAPHYDENQSVRAPVLGGRQVIALTTPATLLAGRLRLDPGLVAGRYAIHGIEIRSGTVMADRVDAAAPAR